MSGYNYTRVRTPEERIQDLENLNVNLQQREQQLQNAINAANSNLNSEMQRIRNEMIAREREHQNAINSMESDLQESEKRQQQALIEQRNDFEQSLKKQANETKQQIGDLKDWTKNNLNKQRKEYLEIAEKHENRINKLQNSVNSIFEKEKNKQDIVQKRLNDLRKLISDVDKNLPHRRFAPGELDRVADHLRNAENDIKLMPESANSSIREGYQQLVELREKVIRKKNEFDIIYNETLQGLNTILAQLQSKDIEVGKVIRNIDYWTDDEYSKLEKEIQAIKSKLEKEKDSISIDSVQKILDEIGKLEEKQQKIVKKATNRVLASIQREKIAIAIAKKLKDEKYPIMDGNGYESKDPRKAYLVKSKLSNNPESTEIIAIIEPEIVDETQIQNVLIINSNDNFGDEQKRIRAQKIAEALKEVGCEIHGNTECKSHQSIKELEGDAVKQIVQANSKGIPENVRRKLFE